MAKWYMNVKKVKWSNAYTPKRFYNSFDMAEAKREEARINSAIKRGEKDKGTHQYLSGCPCGCSGCFIGGTYTNSKQQ